MVSEFKSILDLMEAFPDEESCILHLERLRWVGQVVSPFDPESRVYVCKGHKYKCKNTGKYFNVKTGTIFEDTKIPLRKWFHALYLFGSHKKGISSHQLAKDISVTQKSAWFILHRLRYAFDHPNFKKAMEGTVEIDEAYIGGDYNNKHNSAKKKGVGRGPADKQAVLGMRERQKYVIVQHVPNTRSRTLVPAIVKSIQEGATVFTDEHKSYSLLHLWFQNDRVKHKAKEYVDGMIHTNGIENFWSHLKRGIDGIYHWVMQAYLDEYAPRYNTRDIETCGRFDLILENIAGRLKYEDLIR